MNRPIRILSIGCLILFVGMLLNVNYLQFVSADDLNDRTGNKRVIDDQFSRDRGPILVGDEPVAESVEIDDEYEFQRKYPEPFLYAHLTGYFSYIYGNSSIEDSQNDILSGSDDRLFVNRVVDLVGSEQPKGGSVSLSINRKAQRAAQQGLNDLDRFGSGFKGSVAALDPKTGAILAMANRPSYNPNQLASHDFDKVQNSYKRLLDDKSNPMLNRAAAGIAPPGSTFKPVVAAAALDKLDMKPSSPVDGAAQYNVNGYTMPNESGSTCLPGSNRATLVQALENSCNVSFGHLAVDIGEDALRKQAEKFGFGQDFLQGLKTNISVFESSASADMSDNEDLLAKTGIGQQDLSATPLQMAMISAGIANDGEVMEPYIVDEVRSPDFDTLDKADPRTIDGQPAMSSGNAETLQDMMVSVVNNGTGSNARISGVDVGGKTGTAQRGEGDAPYSWFISFAPADDPKVAVAVMVDPPLDFPGSEVSGNGMAAPIAKSVTEAVLG